MKTTTSPISGKIAVVALLGAFAAAPVLAQDATMPATPPTTATPSTSMPSNPATPEAATTAEPAADAVRVTGTVAEAAGDGKSYSVEVATQSGKTRPIAVDASAVTGGETFAVGDTVSIVGTLDADQTKLTASAITKADAAGQ
ncbi:MAG: hypothetical protein B7Z26_07125 [Asticcacaulis sp. 32-58-5]|nr:MAG: hypothetical protein B7Z26_07125 [Asticcacaulis sp. 32-58-5]